MADLKISALTASTVPLAGTEVLPIVQSSTTKQVSVANLTAGRAVSVLSAVTTSGNNTTAFLSNGATTGWQNWVISNTSGKIYLGIEGSTAGVFCVGDTAYDAVIIGKSGISFSGNDGSATHLRLGSTGNTTFSVGNLIQGTAAKGINFTANTPAAGMTSQLLNWYEEGTWTPTQGAGLAVIGTFTSAAKYTRIGRQVTVIGYVAGSTSVAVTVGDELCGGMPFSSLDYCLGTASDNDAKNGISLYGNATSLYAANAIASATPRINFGATFFV